MEHALPVPLLVGLMACGPRAGTIRSDDAANSSKSDDGPSGVWRRAGGVPSARDPMLQHGEETAPGRHDGPDGISGFCPPRADVFALGGARTLVLREPCSGPTLVVVRDGVGEHRLENAFIGVVGKWRALPLLRDRVLLVNEASPGSTLGTALLVADLPAGRVTYLDLPRDLHDPRRLEVQVVHGQIFLYGGAIQEGVGVGGCESPPPGQGCDPYVLKEERPNYQVWAIVPAD
jgi:hypothetical protein